VRGIATIDRRPGSGIIAVWVTTAVEPLRARHVNAVVIDAAAHQAAISAAIAEYRRRTRSYSLKDPVFPVSPKAVDHLPAGDAPSGRALAAANFLAAAWTAWLKTDEERRRRTARPKTGETPWMMPEDLNSAEVAGLPPAFAGVVHEQAVV